MRLRINISPEDSENGIDFGVDVSNKYFNLAKEGIRIIEAVRQAIVNIKFEGLFEEKKDDEAA